MLEKSALFLFFKKPTSLEFLSCKLIPRLRAAIHSQQGFLFFLIIFDTKQLES